MSSTSSRLPSLNFSNLESKGWQIFDSFFTELECQRFLKELEELKAAKLLKPAEIGKEQKQNLNKTVRQTEIFWIDPLIPTPTQSLFLERMQELLEQLRKLTYIPLKHFECHYSIYPIGGYYERHKDQFQGDLSRQISFILYLDGNWQPTEGGELVLYNEKSPEDVDQILRPAKGRLVVFMSESIEHEVRPTLRLRHSLTGWMRI